MQSVRPVRFKINRAWPPAAESIESPYDLDARYRHQRDTQWTGSMVHVSETCEPTAPHLLTHVHTTAATVHEAQCTVPIHQALVEKALPPGEHLVDAAYISAALLVESHEQQGIILRGPTRPTQGWQAQVEGGYTIEQFEVDWAQQRVRCPQGKWSVAWWDQGAQTSGRAIFVEFARDDCQACPARPVCTVLTCRHGASGSLVCAHTSTGTRPSGRRTVVRRPRRTTPRPKATRDVCPSRCGPQLARQHSD